MPLIKEFLLENFHRRKEVPSSNQRIEYLDLAKGVCILIVVFLHADISSSLLTPLYLPLFFVLSGFFFKDYDSFLNFLVRKINQLIIPLLFFFAIGILVRLATNPDISIIYLLKQPFVEPTLQNEPIWFLICLFWVNIFYYFMQKGIANSIGRLVLCVSCGLIGFVLDYYSVYLPLFLGPAFSATPFFFVGVMLRKFPVLYRTAHDKAILVSAIMLLIALIAYCLMDYTPLIIFKDNRYTGNYPEVIIVSVLMVICFLILCKTVRWLPVISYFGRYSIIVLGVHSLFLGYAYLPVHLLTGHVFSQPELLGLALLLSWISIPFLKKYFKKFCAQDDLIVLPRNK